MENEVGGVTEDQRSDDQSGQRDPDDSFCFIAIMIDLVHRISRQELDLGAGISGVVLKHSVGEHDRHQLSRVGLLVFVVGLVFGDELDQVEANLGGDGRGIDEMAADRLFGGRLVKRKLHVSIRAGVNDVGSDGEQRIRARCRAGRAGVCLSGPVDLQTEGNRKRR